MGSGLVPMGKCPNTVSRTPRLGHGFLDYSVKDTYRPNEAGQAVIKQMSNHHGVFSSITGSIPKLMTTVDRASIDEFTIIDYKPPYPQTSFSGIKKLETIYF